MERQHSKHDTRPENVTTPEVMLRVKPDDLVPDEAQVAEWRERLTAEQQVRAAYCLGVLMASVQGAGQAIAEGDGRWLTHHLSIGLAAMTAYDRLAAEERIALGNGA